MLPKIGILRLTHVFVVLIALPTRVGWADSFDVRPVSIVTHGEITSVTVTNSADQRMYLETVLYDWGKDAAGQDQLTESSTAIASPPAMWIPPHSSYVIRLSLPKASGTREMSYRVMLQQVADRAAMQAGRVVITVTQSLPAFSQPEQMDPPALHGQLQDGKLIIENTGGRHARIEAISQDSKLLAQGLLGYALPGTRLALKFPVHAGRVDVHTDTGDVALNVR